MASHDPAPPSSGGDAPPAGRRDAGAPGDYGSASSVGGAAAAQDNLYQGLGKLARLAGEALDASATLLARTQALVRERVEDHERSLAPLISLGGQLPQPARGGRASARELGAVMAAARQLLLRSSETVLRIRTLIDGETIALRFRWHEKPAATMADLHGHLDQARQWVLEAGACLPELRHDIQTLERSFLNMREVARQHRAVADGALRTAEQLQEQAATLMRRLELAGRAPG